MLSRLEFIGVRLSLIKRGRFSSLRNNVLGTTTTIRNNPWTNRNYIRLYSSSNPLRNIEISNVSPDVASLIHKHASRSQTGASLQTLMKTGRGEYLHKTFENEPAAPADAKVATDKILMQVAGFLRHELPIRLAHRILDLERVPLMKEMESVQQVKDLYVMSFLELLSVEKQISTMQQEEAFAQILESIYERHASVLVQMARGAFELRAAIRTGTVSLDEHHHYKYHKNTNGRKRVGGPVEFDVMEDTHAFLDRFYISRIGYVDYVAFFSIAFVCVCVQTKSHTSPNKYIVYVYSLDNICHFDNHQWKITLV